MISFKAFFRQKLARFFTILFAGLLLLANLSVYISSSVQYSRQIERQETSLAEMMAHLILLEEPGTAEIYLEHYGHTHGVELAYFDAEGTVLYQSPGASLEGDRIAIRSISGETLGELTIGYQASILGTEVWWGLVILNGVSLGLFALGLGILYRYLNQKYAVLEEDLQKIGKEDQSFRFSDIESINERHLASLRTVKDLKTLQSKYVQILAHDLKTPLTVIKAVLDGVRLGRIPFDDKVNRELLSEVAAMEQLIPQFIVLDTREMPQKQNLAPIIRGVLEKLSEVFPTKDIRVESRLDDLERTISALDVLRITEHLVVNAFYYSKPSGTIEVVLDAALGTLRVRDSGIGMTPETLENIRKGPFRDERAIGFHQKGSGIGLQIVFGIVERIHARIEFDSEPDVGTTVTVTF